MTDLDFDFFETELLLDGAELLKLEKELKEGGLAPFEARHKELFKQIEKERFFFTGLERERIVYYLLQSIEAKKEELMALDQSKLVENETIILKLIHDGAIQAIFPLHDRTKVNWLLEYWVHSFFEDQPLDSVIL